MITVEKNDTTLYPLHGYRILDLTDEKGLFCSKLLADLGADVIAIEPPCGNPARRIGPFFHNNPNVEMSFFWYAYSSSKRSITLNIDTTDGQHIFKKLAEFSAGWWWLSA